MGEVNYEEMSLQQLERLLNDKQKRFAAELDKGEGTAADAYTRAGFAKKGAAANASRLMKSDKFAAYRRARTLDLYAKKGITPAWVGERLVEIVDRCMAAKPHLSWDMASHEWQPDGTWTFDAKGATTALKAIGESMGMFKPSAKSEGSGGTTINFVMAPGMTEEVME